MDDPNMLLISIKLVFLVVTPFLETDLDHLNNVSERQIKYKVKSWKACGEHWKRLEHKY